MNNNDLFEIAYEQLIELARSLRSRISCDLIASISAIIMPRVAKDRAKYLSRAKRGGKLVRRQRRDFVDQERITGETG